MSHQAKRKHRVDWIMNQIQEGCNSGKAIKYDELIAKACLDFGAGERYIKEILKHLVFSGMIVVEFGDVFTKNYYEKLRHHENRTEVNKNPQEKSNPESSQAHEKQDLENDDVLEKLS